MTIDDFRRGMDQLKNVGSLTEIMAMIPGLGQLGGGLTTIDAEAVKRVQGIIDSMTPRERSYPWLIPLPTRCLRIAEGAGVKPADVLSFHTQFRAMSELLRQTT